VGNAVRRDDAALLNFSEDELCVPCVLSGSLCVGLVGQPIGALVDVLVEVEFVKDGACQKGKPAALANTHQYRWVFQKHVGVHEDPRHIPHCYGLLKSLSTSASVRTLRWLSPQPRRSARSLL
jgi:hypothetical protein